MMRVEDEDNLDNLRSEDDADLSTLDKRYSTDTSLSLSVSLFFSEVSKVHLAFLDDRARRATVLEEQVQL